MQKKKLENMPNTPAIAVLVVVFSGAALWATREWSGPIIRETMSNIADMPRRTLDILADYDEALYARRHGEAEQPLQPQPDTLSGFTPRP